MPKAEIHSFFDPVIQTVSHVVAAPANRYAAIIDSVSYLKLPIDLL